MVHGGDNDVLWLQRDFHVYMVNVFDTEKACQVMPTSFHPYSAVMCTIKYILGFRFQGLQMMLFVQALLQNLLVMHATNHEAALHVKMWEIRVVLNLMVVASAAQTEKDKASCLLCRCWAGTKEAWLSCWMCTAMLQLTKASRLAIGGSGTAYEAALLWFVTSEWHLLAFLPDC